MRPNGATIDGLVAPEYRSWRAMRYRCLNRRSRQYAAYGGRGIAICARWESYAAFRADMGPRPSLRHTIDRIDNDGPYSPENCRWATPEQQQGNRSISCRLTFRGETLHAAEWARRIGISVDAISYRLARGWTVDRVLTTAQRHQLVATTPDGRMVDEGIALAGGRVALAEAIGCSDTRLSAARRGSEKLGPRTISRLAAYIAAAVAAQAREDGAP